MRARHLLESRPLCIGIVLHKWATAYTDIRTCIYRAFSESLTNEASLQSLPRTRCTRASCFRCAVRSARFTVRETVLFDHGESHGEALNIIDQVRPTYSESRSSKTCSRSFLNNFYSVSSSSQTASDFGSFFYFYCWLLVIVRWILSKWILWFPFPLWRPFRM